MKEELSFFSGKEGNVSGIHYVSKDIQISTGACQTEQLREGDILIVGDGFGGLLGGLNAGKNDVILCRADSTGGYTFSTLLHIPEAKKIQGLTLIEDDVIVGNTQLSSGNFLFLKKNEGGNGPQGNGENCVYLYETESFRTSLLFDGNSVGFHSKLTGIELIERDTVAGGEYLEAGTVLLSAKNRFTINNTEVDPHDIFAVHVKPTGQATMSILFDGEDLGLNNVGAKIDGLSLNVEQQTISPDNTIASGVFDATAGTLALHGTKFDSLGNVGDDIRDQLDWSKLVWDVDSDDCATADITFTEDDVESAVIKSDTELVIHLKESKIDSITGNANYAALGGAVDTLDIGNGFSVDSAGVASTKDGLVGGELVTITPPGNIHLSNSTLNDPYESQIYPCRELSTFFLIR